MMAEQRLREKLLKTARHVDQITAMVARAHTGKIILFQVNDQVEHVSIIMLLENNRYFIS